MNNAHTRVVISSEYNLYRLVLFIVVLAINEDTAVNCLLPLVGKVGQTIFIFVLTH